MKWYKKLYENMKKFMKKNWNWLKNLLKILGGCIIILCVARKVAQIGEVKYEKKWEPIAGSKTKVLVKDDNGNQQVVELPKNPETGKQITVDEIKQVGLPKNYDKEERLNVTITSNPTINRRAIAGG